MKCPICYKKFKNDLNYINHLELFHKNNKDCGCQDGGKKYGEKYIPTNNNMSKKLQQTMIRAQNKINQVEKNINTNALAFSLKLDKKEINKIPVGVREKVQNLLLENQYLRGVVEANNKQIQIMKRQVDKCIANIGVHYTIKK